MIDHTTHLQAPGRIADRQADARARRLAAEAAASDVERTFWLTDRLRTVRASGGTVLARIHGFSVRPRTGLDAAADRA